MKLEFYIVDVFAERKCAGNQLAVFRNSGHLSTEEMQTMAREMNFSESTFITSDEMRDGGFDVRIFTPAHEVPFAGHPTLGTAFIIKECILKKDVEQINLNLKVGQIPVRLYYEGNQLQDLWMKQINPVFGRTLPADDVAAILGLTADDIDRRFPIHEVSTGIPFFIVPIRTLHAVQRIKVNGSVYDQFIREINPDLHKSNADQVPATAFFVFCPEALESENHLHARMFDDYYGVPEDPATGSANGCFLAYLLKHHYFGKSELDLRVEQGYEMGRPSLVKIKGKVVSEDQMDIFVGGKVEMIARAEWL